MNKKQQNLAWRCLPKEARDEIKNYQIYSPISGHTKELIEIVFGYHNLTSDEEPPELLFVEREKVVEKRNEVTKDYIETGDKWYSGYINALNEFFGNKCLSDKEPMKIDAADSLIAMAKDEMDINDTEPSVQSEPKFKVGDKVRYISQNHEIGEIAAYWPDQNFCYSVRFGKEYHNMAEHQLEPYTEPEYRNLSQNIANCDKTEDNKMKDNMEEKELNRKALYDALCELESASVKVRKALISM